MEIIQKKISEIRPYEKNPRKNDAAAEYVANSIREFGWKQPVVIDKDGVIIAGHTRYKAAKILGMDEIPCVIASDLTPEQVKAYRLADNKVGEMAEWDLRILGDELAELDGLFEMEDFGFDDDDFTAEERHEEMKEITQERVSNILNLEYAQYPGVGPYDIPEILPVYETPPVKEWIGFNYMLSDKGPEGKGIHFFIDDYQFNRIWSNPDAYIDKLSQYSAVIAPDFSPYGDMPLITQVFNHYRKHWTARYLQEHGVTIIPCIRASTDPRSMDWYLDGEPEGGIVAISSMWTRSESEKEIFRHEYGKMKETLKPSKILIYGKKLDVMEGDNIEIIPTFSDRFSDRRFSNGER